MEQTAEELESVPKDNHKIVGLEVLVSLLFLCLSHNLA